MIRIRKNDKVIVLAGKDKGKIGKVIRVFPGQAHVLIEKVNLIKKAKRRTQQDQKGGFIHVEAPIHLSNVMLVDKDGKGSRCGMSILKDGTRVRTLKTTGETI